MKAQLKRLHSPEVDDLRAYAPTIPSHFGLFVQAMVGPDHQDAEESFDLVVCTPSWIAEQVEVEGPLLGTHHLVVGTFAYDQIEGYIRSFCDRCNGDTWQDVARKIGRLGRWEFEDYHE